MHPPLEMSSTPNAILWGTSSSARSCSPFATWTRWFSPAKTFASSSWNRAPTPCPTPSGPGSTATTSPPRPTVLAPASPSLVRFHRFF